MVQPASHVNQSINVNRKLFNKSPDFLFMGFAKIEPGLFSEEGPRARPVLLVFSRATPGSYETHPP